MAVLNEAQRRALTFIQAANHGGYSPTPDEVIEWVERPDVKPGEVTRRVVNTPGIKRPDLGIGLAASAYFDDMNRKLAKSMEEINRQMMRSVMPAASQFASLANLMGGERVIEERGPDETLIEQLKRFHWIETSATGAGLMLTGLGKALLRADTDQHTDSDVTVLDGDDPLAWGSLVGTIAEAGECLIVDPYLKSEQFLDIAKLTGTTRVILRRPQKDHELVPWRLYQAIPDVDVTIRVADPQLLHDRYIVGETSVYLLGCSLNGVGRKPTTLVPLKGRSLIGSARRWRAGGRLPNQSVKHQSQKRSRGRTVLTLRSTEARKLRLMTARATTHRPRRDCLATASRSVLRCPLNPRWRDQDQPRSRCPRM